MGAVALQDQLTQLVGTELRGSRRDRAHIACLKGILLSVTGTMDASAESADRGVVARRSSSWKYILGNGVATLMGLGIAYAALRYGSIVPAQLLSPGNSDLNAYFSAAELILHGHAGQIYNLQHLALLEHQIAPPTWPRDQVTAYVYPPAFSVLLVPLTLLPFTVAYAIWIGLNAILFASALLVLERYAQLSRRQSFWARAAASTFLPVIYCFFVGQAAILLLALTVFAFASLRSGNQLIAGALLACTLLKPQYTLALFVFLLGRRLWLSLAGFVATALVLLLLPLPLVGWNTYLAYARLAAHVTSWQGQTGRVIYQHMTINPSTYEPAPNQSWAGFVEALAGKQTVIVAALVAASLVAVLVVALRSRRVDEPFALAVIAGVLVSPHTLAYDLPVMLLPLAVLLRWKNRRIVATLSLLTYAGVALGFAIGYLTPVHPIPLLIVLLAACLCMGWKDVREPSPRRLTAGWAPRDAF